MIDSLPKPGNDGTRRVSTPSRDSACTRRAPAARALAFALALVALAGCGSRGGGDADTLVVAMPTFSEGTFLPWNGSTGRKLYLDTVYEYLAYLDPETLAPQPGLATDWQVSDDGLTWQLTIRRGVQFQHGWGEMTAEDVKYTLQRLVGPDAIAGPSSPLRTLISEVEAPSSHELIVRLTTPDIEFVSAYLSNGSVVPIVSREHLEAVGDSAANRQPVGTGAFEFERHVEGVSITVRRRDDASAHWRVSPEFERIRFVSVPEEFTRTAMLRAGEVDLAPVNFDSIPALQAAGLRIRSVPANWAPVIRLGGLVPRFADENVPWADVRVRQALNLAVDKETIVAAVFHGHARPAGADFPAPEWFDLKPYPYDPPRARQLLREAGYPDGFDIRIRTYTTTPGAELPIVAEAVALYWQAIGLRVRIEPTNWTSLRSAWTTGHARDIAWSHRGMAFSTALAGLQASAMTGSLFASFADEHTDALIDAIGHALEPAKRRRLVEAIGRYQRDQAAAVFIAFADEPYGISDRVGHWPALSQQGTNVDLITRHPAPDPH